MICIIKWLLGDPLDWRRSMAEGGGHAHEMERRADKGPDGWRCRDAVGRHRSVRARRGGGARPLGEAAYPEGGHHGARGPPDGGGSGGGRGRKGCKGGEAPRRARECPLQAEDERALGRRVFPVGVRGIVSQRIV